MMEQDNGATLAGQALVSDQAATRLTPSGFDPSRDGWPIDGSPLSFEQLSRPILHAIRCAYSLERKDRRRNVPWHGPEIGQGERACSLLASMRLKAVNLNYAEDDQGRDALEEIIGLAIQLGIEQGRRVSRSTASELLDNAYGAKFTVTVGYQQTSIHTESGLLVMPAKAIAKAIEALTVEAARVDRCPRHRALCAQGMAARSDETLAAQPEGQQPGPKDAPQ